MLNSLLWPVVIVMATALTRVTTDESASLSENQVWRLLSEQTQTVMRALLPGGSGAIHRAHQLMWTAPLHARASPAIRQPRYAVLSITGPPMMQSHEQQILDVAVAASSSTAGGQEALAGTGAQTNPPVIDTKSEARVRPKSKITETDEAHSWRSRYDEEVIYGRPVHPFLSRKTGVSKDSPGAKKVSESGQDNNVNSEKVAESLLPTDFATPPAISSRDEWKAVGGDRGKEWKSALKRLNKAVLADQSTNLQPSIDIGQSFTPNSDAFRELHGSGKKRISQGFSDNEEFITNFSNKNHKVESRGVDFSEQSDHYEPSQLETFPHRNFKKLSSLATERSKAYQSEFNIDNIAHKSFDSSVSFNALSEPRLQTGDKEPNLLNSNPFRSRNPARQVSQAGKSIILPHESDTFSDKNDPMHAKNVHDPIRTQAIFANHQHLGGFHPLLFPNINDKKNIVDAETKEFAHPTLSLSMSKYSDNINDILSEQDYFKTDLQSVRPQSKGERADHKKNIKNISEPRPNLWFNNNFAEDGASVRNAPILETSEAQQSNQDQPPIKNFDFALSGEKNFQFHDGYFGQTPKITPMSHHIEKAHLYTSEVFKPTKTLSDYLPTTKYDFRANRDRPALELNQISGHLDTDNQGIKITPKRQDDHFRKTLGNIKKIKDVSSQYEKFRSDYISPHNSNEASSFTVPTDTLPERDQLNGLDTTLKKLQNAKLKAESIFNGSYEEFDTSNLQVSPIASEVENNLKNEWNLISQQGPLPAVEQNKSPPKESEHMTTAEPHSSEPVEYPDKVEISEFSPFPDIPIPSTIKNFDNSNFYMSNRTELEMTTSSPQYHHEPNEMPKNESLSQSSDMDEKVNTTQSLEKLRPSTKIENITSISQTDTNGTQSHQESIERSASVGPDQMPINNIRDSSGYIPNDDTDSDEIISQFKNEYNDIKAQNDSEHQPKEKDIGPHLKPLPSDPNTEPSVYHKDEYTNNNRRAFFFFDGYHTENGGSNDHFPRAINHHGYSTPGPMTFHPRSPEPPQWWQEEYYHRESPAQNDWVGSPIVYTASQTPLFRRYKATTTYKPRIFVSPQRVKIHHVSVTSSPVVKDDGIVTSLYFDSGDALDEIEGPYTEENTRTPVATTSSPATNTPALDVELFKFRDKKQSFNSNAKLTENSKHDEENSNSIPKEKVEPIKSETTSTPQREAEKIRKVVSTEKTDIFKTSTDKKPLKRNKFYRNRTRLPLQTTVAPKQQKEVIVKKVTFPAFPGSSDKIQLESIVKFGERIHPKHRYFHNVTSDTENNRRRKIPTSLRSRIRKLRLNNRYHNNTSGQLHVQDNQNQQQNHESEESDLNTTLKILRITTEPATPTAEERMETGKSKIKITGLLEDQDRGSTKNKPEVSDLQGRQEQNSLIEELFQEDTTTPSAASGHTDLGELSAMGSSRITMVIPTDAVAAMRNLESDTVDLVLENNSETEDASVDVMFDDDQDEADLILSVPDAENTDKNVNDTISPDSIFDVIDFVEETETSKDSLPLSSANQEIVSKNYPDAGMVNKESKSSSNMELNRNQDLNYVVDSTLISTTAPNSLVTTELNATPTIESHTTPTIEFHTTPTIESHTTPTIELHTTPTVEFNTDPTSVSLKTISEETSPK